MASAGWASGLWYWGVIGLAGRLRHADAAISMDEFRRGLELHYHSLGGFMGRRVVGDAGLLQRRRFAAPVPGGILDLMAWLDPEQVHLPKVIDRYPSRDLNRELYYWLAAFLAVEQPVAGEGGLPLGVRHVLRGVAGSVRLQKTFPALAERYRRLCQAELVQRANVLPGWGPTSRHPVRVLEAGIRYALGSGQAPRDEWLVEALNAAQEGHALPEAPRHFPCLLPFLPVPLWGHPAVTLPALRFRPFKRRLRRRAQGTGRRLARPRFDPAQEPPSVAGGAVEDRYVYPEWEYGRKAYRAAWCVVTEPNPVGGHAQFEPVNAVLARQVRRQFEALRQLSGWHRRLERGEEIDIDAYVASIADKRGCGRQSARVFQERRRRRRDLSVAVLLDASRSTEAWIGERRVIGIARQSMLVLAEALAAADDDFGLYAFNSDSRLRVCCYRIKDFTEPYGETSRARLLALKPEHYTRMGAAIRHVGSRLERRAAAEKLLLVLTDGRPNDPCDGYEGRYALEDTRRALLELRARGLHCFGLTIDQQGRDYLPHLFGAGHYGVYSDPQSLPRMLPRLYARMTAHAS